VGDSTRQIQFPDAVKKKAHVQVREKKGIGGGMGKKLPRTWGGRRKGGGRGKDDKELSLWRNTFSTLNLTSSSSQKK